MHRIDPKQLASLFDPNKLVTVLNHQIVTAAGTEAEQVAAFFRCGLFRTYFPRVARNFGRPTKPIFELRQINIDESAEFVSLQSVVCITVSKESHEYLNAC